MALLYYYDQNTFLFSFFPFFFLNLVISGKSKALISLAYVISETHNLQRVSRPPGGGEGVVPYMGYRGMCRAKGYVFLAVLVWNRVSI